MITPDRSSILPLAFAILIAMTASTGLAAAPSVVCPPTFFNAPFTSLTVDGPAWSLNELDYDGDGRMDLAVSYFLYTGGPAIYETIVAFFVQGPDGVYRRSPYEIHEDGVGQLGNRAGDFNGDGIPDLVLTNQREQVVVFLGQRSGSFERFVLGSTSLQNVLDTSVADLNGDGRDDLVSRIYFSATLQVSLSRGDGQFDDLPAINSFPRSRALAITDLNGDGIVDVASAEVGRGIEILLGRGDGTFGDPTAYSTPSPYTTGIAAGDLNGDGFQDLAVAGQASACGGATSAVDSTVYVFYGHGDGSFEPARSLLAGPRPGPIAIGDLDGDGIADLAVGLGGGYAEVSCFDAVSPTRGPDMAASMGVGTGSVEASGFPYGRVAVFLGDRSGDLRLHGSYPAGSTVDGMFISATACDEIPDIVALDAGPWGSVSILQGHGDGSFGEEHSFQTLDSPGGVVAVDLDHDGRAEGVVANWLDGSVSVFRNLDGRAPGQRAEYPAAPGANNLASGDFNRDGNPDIAVAYFGSPDSTTVCGSGVGGIAVMMGDGAGGLGVPELIPLDGRANSVVAGDLDRDGNLDLVVPMFSPCGGVWVLLGHGDGGFTVSRVLETSVRPQEVWLADVNRDGILDLVLQARYSPGPSISLGRGDGTFGTPTLLTAPTLIGDVADINGDGIVDLIGYSSVFIGLGDGTFSPGPSFEAAAGRVKAVDLNGDGAADLVLWGNRLALILSKSAGVLFGRGDGSFSSSIRWGTGLGLVGTATGDVDADGRPDLLVTNADSKNLSVLLNRGAAPTALAARAFLAGGARTIPVGRSSEPVRVRLQPIAGGFSIQDLVPASIRMVSQGTGSVGSISAQFSKESRIGDTDGDGVPEYELIFSGPDLAHLFSLVRGRKVIPVSIEGLLSNGRPIRAPLSMTVLNQDLKRVATVTPNPLNPAGELRFLTTRAGSLTIRLFDVQGRLVATPRRETLLPAGDHAVTLDGKSSAGSPLASGIYLFRIDSADGTEQGRFTILK